MSTDGCAPGSTVRFRALRTLSLLAMGVLAGCASAGERGGLAPDPMSVPAESEEPPEAARGRAERKDVTPRREEARGSAEPQSDVPRAAPAGPSAPAAQSQPGLPESEVTAVESRSTEPQAPPGAGLPESGEAPGEIGLGEIDVSDIEFPGEVDLDEVDVSDIRSLEFHGRADLAYVHFGDSDNVDDFRRSQVLSISSGIYGRYRLLDWLFIVGEVEYDGREESVEVDQAVFEMDVVEEHLRLRVGRYYFPFGLERAYYSPSRNTLVDRPAAFRQVYPGTYSDNGIFVEGEYMHHTLWKLGYEAAVVQGLQGFDREDTPKTLEDNNDTPQIGGRIYFQPRPELTFGASYAIGFWDDDDDEILDFFGVDARLHIFEIDVRAEYVGGRVQGTEEFGSFFRHGWYVHVEKTFELELPYLYSIVPVFRVDWINPNDKEKSFLDVTRYSPGIAVFFLENLQLKAEFSISDERGGHELSNNGFLTQIVFSW